MNFLQKKKVSIYGTKEACRPLWNQTRWRYCSPQSLSPGNSGTNTNKCGKSLDSRKNQKINVTENRQWAGECVTKKRAGRHVSSVCLQQRAGRRTDVSFRNFLLQTCCCMKSRSKHFMVTSNVRCSLENMLDTLTN